MRQKTKKTFKNYYEGTISSDQFIDTIKDNIGIVVNFTLGSLRKTALKEHFEIGLLDTKYEEFKKNEISRFVIGIKLELGKEAQLRLYLIPTKKYTQFITTFYWKNSKFTKRTSVLKKPCMVKTFEPFLDPKKKSFWTKIANACDNLRIPKIIEL